MKHSRPVPGNTYHLEDLVSDVNDRILIGSYEMFGMHDARTTFMEGIARKDGLYHEGMRAYLDRDKQGPMMLDAFGKPVYRLDSLMEIEKEAVKTIEARNTMQKALFSKGNRFKLSSLDEFLANAEANPDESRYRRIGTEITTHHGSRYGAALNDANDITERVRDMSDYFRTAPEVVLADLSEDEDISEDDGRMGDVGRFAVH